MRVFVDVADAEHVVHDAKIRRNDVNALFGQRERRTHRRKLRVAAVARGGGDVHGRKLTAHAVGILERIARIARAGTEGIVHAHIKAVQAVQIFKRGAVIGIAEGAQAALGAPRLGVGIIAVDGVKTEPAGSFIGLRPFGGIVCFRLHRSITLLFKIAKSVPPRTREKRALSFCTRSYKVL